MRFSLKNDFGLLVSLVVVLFVALTAASLILGWHTPLRVFEHDDAPFEEVNGIRRYKIGSNAVLEVNDEGGGMVYIEGSLVLPAAGESGFHSSVRQGRYAIVYYTPQSQAGVRSPIYYAIIYGDVGRIERFKTGSAAAAERWKTLTGQEFPPFFPTK